MNILDQFCTARLQAREAINQSVIVVLRGIRRSGRTRSEGGRRR
jgi:hypothetical protein